MSQDSGHETQDVEEVQPVLSETNFGTILSDSQNEELAWAISLSELVAEAWEVGISPPTFVLAARSEAWQAAGMPEVEDDIREWEREYRSKQKR